MSLDAAARREFADLGVTIAGADEADGGGNDDAVPVWDVNWISLTAFLDCATQWRVVAGFGAAARLGLDYAGVDALLSRRGLGDGVFEDIRVMEFAALDAFAEAGD